MEELSEGGSRRPSRGVDEREEKVAAAEIVGRTKKMENRYEKEEDICFSEEDICFSEKDIFFWKIYFLRVREKERFGWKLGRVEEFFFFFWEKGREELFGCEKERHLR